MSRRLSLPLSVIFLVVSIPAHAANDAHDWLTRIRHAARSLNYEGVFVYQNGSRLETMRIYHRVKHDTVEERIVSLTGPTREIIRTDKEVRCYLPDQKAVVVELNSLNQRSFPGIIPERLPDLDQNYAIELGASARVSGREAQRVLIRARDEYRYGYRLWADRETGILLRAEVIDANGRALEQFMFTQIRVGIGISDLQLAPQVSGEGMVWYRETEVTTPPKQSWRVTRLPKGFELSRAIIRKLPNHDRPVEQLVYSDGLAAVSVFVERHDGRVDAAAPQGRGGALNAVGRPVNDHHVVVVGEVPAKTISMISGSIVPAAP